MAWLIAAVALLVLAPLLAWAGRSQGKRIKGGIAIAFLGIGAIFDPPRRQDLEVHKREERESPSPGDPEDPEED
jgi:hypothetical protein